MNTETKIFCEVCKVRMDEVEVLSSGGMNLHLMICPECGESATLITSGFIGRLGDFWQVRNSR